MEKDLKEMKEIFEKLKWTGSNNLMSRSAGGKRPMTNITGLVWDYITKEYRESRFDYHNPHIWGVISKFMAKWYPDHQFNTFTLNKNFQCLPHFDRGSNIGKSSFIIGLGDYEGGKLCWYDDYKKEIKRVDIKYRPYFFDGANVLHWVENWKGDRYSMVSYYI